MHDLPATSSLNPYPAMKDSGVPWLGEVPAHWPVMSLRAMLESRVGGSWGNEPEAGGTLARCIRGTDFDLTRLTAKIANAPMRSYPAEDIARRRLREGDLVMATSGGSEELAVGSVVLFEASECALPTNFAARLVPRNDSNARYLVYLHYALNKAGVTQALTKKVTIANLDTDAYLLTHAPFPPLPEQAAIARYLDYADRRIRRYIRAKQKLIKLLEEQKQAIIHRAVTRGLKPNVRLKSSGVEWLGDVPEHWDVKPLKFLVPHVTVGIVIQPARLYVPSGVPCLRSLNISGGVIDDRELVFISSVSNEVHRKSQIFTDDIVVVRTGRAGVAAIVTPDFNRANCIDLLIVRASERLNSTYLQVFMNSWAARTDIKYRSVGAIQAHYNTATLASLIVPVPPIQEQEAMLESMAEELEPLNAASVTAQSEIWLLREYRIRLTADVVTGKLDVREAAARLPDDIEESEPVDEVESGEEESGEVDAVPQEVEA